MGAPRKKRVAAGWPKSRPQLPPPASPSTKPPTTTPTEAVSTRAHLKRCSSAHSSGSPSKHSARVQFVRAPILRFVSFGAPVTAYVIRAIHDTAQTPGGIDASLARLRAGRVWLPLIRPVRKEHSSVRLPIERLNDRVVSRPSHDPARITLSIGLLWPVCKSST